MDAQRLRNLTTHRLHTKMEDIYKDMEYLIGEQGLMTHNIPNASRAMEPWLRDKVTDARFWDGAFDLGHTGEVPLAPMTESERKEFFARFEALPHPFARLL